LVLKRPHDLTHCGQKILPVCYFAKTDAARTPILPFVYLTKKGSAMRKIVASSLAVTTLFALSACGAEPTTTQTDSSASTSETAPAAAASTPKPAPEPAPEPEVTPASFAELTGDASAGEKLFIKCKTCHVIEDGVNRVGPHLYGVVGRVAGGVEGFNYSKANAQSGVTWSGETLFEFLEAPQTYMKGTRMAFPGIKDARQRADLIAYLEANGEV